MRRISPLPLLLLPAVGGLVLGLLNLALARWYPRTPVDPIEANAVHGGQASIKDGLVVAAWGWRRPMPRSAPGLHPG